MKIFYTSCLRSPYGSWLFRERQKRDKFDKTLDREVGGALPNCVKPFTKLSFIELKMFKYHPLSGGATW